MSMTEQAETAIILALGTNLGDRLQNLKEALQKLSANIKIDRCSRVYETPPWGYLDQPAFLNQVVTGRTFLKPQQLLSFVKQVESNMGRVKNFRNGPRLIDIDILVFGDQTLALDDLVIPHPCMAERAFVLVPLAELEPDLVIPGQKLSVREFLQKVDTDNIEYVAENTTTGLS